VTWSKDVFSSMASTISYNEETQELIITYNSGKSYAYAGVTEDVAVGVSNAASVGEFINSEIKGRYQYRRL
jgi:hypothetical protein